MVLEPQTDTLHGGAKADDRFNMYFHRIIRSMRVKTAWVNKDLLECHPAQLGLPVRIRWTSIGASILWLNQEARIR